MYNRKSQAEIMLKQSSCSWSNCVQPVGSPLFFEKLYPSLPIGQFTCLNPSYRSLSTTNSAFSGWPTNIEPNILTTEDTVPSLSSNSPVNTASSEHRSSLVHHHGVRGQSTNQASPVLRHILNARNYLILSCLVINALAFRVPIASSKESSSFSYEKYDNSISFSTRNHIILSIAVARTRSRKI